ncbi:MAG: hypothetical protein IPN69_13590 [Acidobacteria bacterium]|nr:hypothetical protein [Acidobacteriota bacterium]MBK8811749.1 hypothetical protein [Acidobacteriota bacterium]
MGLTSISLLRELEIHLTTMANRADDEYNEFEQNAIQAFLSWERIIKFKFNDNEPQRDSFVSKLMVCLFETVLETATGRLLDKPDIVEFRSKASTALANRQIRDALCREFEKLDFSVAETRYQRIRIVKIVSKQCYLNPLFEDCTAPNGDPSLPHIIAFMTIQILVDGMDEFCRDLDLSGRL